MTITATAPIIGIERTKINSVVLGQHVADETARITEYQRAWRANRDGFAPVLTAR